MATETLFFTVMVFEDQLLEKFIPGKAIAFSDYFGIYGSPVIHKLSSVSEVDSQNMENLSSLNERCKNLKISDLLQQAKEIPMDGEFTVIEVSYVKIYSVNFLLKAQFKS